MAQIFVSVVAHFFMSVGGSEIHERLAHFFIDIYIQNKQLLFPALFHVVPVGSVSPGYGDLHQQIWQTDIPDGIKAAAG